MDALVRTRPAVVCAGFGPGRHQADVEKDKQNGLGRANSPARRDRLPPPGRWQSAAGGAGMIRGSPQKLLVGFGLLLIVLVGALQGANLWQEYQREQAVFRERLTAEVRLLAEHARLTLTAADLVLDQLEQVLREHGLENLDDQNGYWLRLRRAVHGVPEFRTLSLNDAQGVNRLTTRHYPGAGRFSISDRDYFLALKEGARSYIGAPILGRSSRIPILPYGRRLEDDEGEFAGIALISLNVRHLQDFYQSAPEGCSARWVCTARTASCCCATPRHRRQIASGPPTRGTIRWIRAPSVWSASPPWMATARSSPTSRCPATHWWWPSACLTAPC